MIELWKNINEKYSVSNFGRVKSITRQSIDNRGRQRYKKGRILKHAINCGYPSVNMEYNGKRQLKKIHQLVALKFVENPNNHKVINHIDGNKENNHFTNLEWCTQSHNLKHAFRTGLREPVINKEGKNGFAKKVINTKTGKIFDSLTQTIRLESPGYKYTTLRAMLTGQNNNKTNFKYL